MTEQQINQIVENINIMLDNARENIRALEELCDEDYLKGREQYSITPIIYSAFNVEVQNIPDFLIQKVQYGGKKKMFLPELFNNQMIIEVFGDKSKPWTTDEVKTKYELFGERFRLLIFSIDKEEYRLSKLQLLSFNGYNANGDSLLIGNRENIYNAPR